MGQVFCKDCCHGDSRTKKGALVTWGADTNSTDDHHDNIYMSASTEDDDYYYYDNTTSNNSTNDHQRKRQSKKRVRHKKRNVALHAEFRDRFYNNSVVAHSSTSTTSSIVSESATMGNTFDPTNINRNATAVGVDSSNNTNSNNNTCNDILAPPLIAAKVMVETDNVFCGVECGVDTLLLSPRDSVVGSSSSYDSAVQASSKLGA